MSAPAAPPPRAPARVGPRAALAGGAALAMLVAAGLARRHDGGPAAARAVAAAAAEPAADFVVAAGDSTYWVTRTGDVRTGDARTGDAPAAGVGDVHVRASALFLARWGGRLSEVYVADDERAFDDGAWFAAQRVYRRDLLSGDSALVFADPRVPRLAARYAAAHPDVRVLDADEAPPTADELDERGDDAAGDDHAPPVGAEATVALAAAHGPYVSLEARTTGADGDGGAPDAVARRVVDLRTAREVSLAGLFGDAAAARLASAGQLALRATVARLRAAARRAAGPVPGADSAARADADAARRALGALATLRFDPAGFGLADVEGAPAVTFVAVGRDADGSAVTLPLPPVPVPGDAPAWWRREVAPALLVRGREPRAEPAARWRPARGAYEVRARRVAGATALELVAAGAPAGGAGRAWPLVRVPTGGPAQLFALDDRATRRALRRAFDESAFYDDAITSVAWRPGGRAQAGRARPLARLAARRP